jgi:hypothetical protein
MSVFNASAKSFRCKQPLHTLHCKNSILIALLFRRLKVPPALSQFQHVLDRNQATQSFKLLNKYRPETKAEKKERLTKEATAVAEGKKSTPEKPYTVKYGLNHVVALVEVSFFAVYFTAA